MKKTMISIILCFALVLSLSSGVAFACDTCRADSFKMNPEEDISVTGDGVRLRPHHRASNNPEDDPGGSADYGATGTATHKYPYQYYYTWVRAEMDNGINGWIYADYVSFS